jgi:hypothetical protein
VLVRPLRAAGARGLTTLRTRAWAAASVLALAGIAACARGGGTAPGVTVVSSLAPAAPSVGPAAISLRLSDARGPVAGARLRVEADMTHPGMRPVLAQAEERGGGLYVAHFAFTMGGDWAILVTGELADGRRVDHRLDVPGVRGSP